MIWICMWFALAEPRSATWTRSAQNVRANSTLIWTLGWTCHSSPSNMFTSNLQREDFTNFLLDIFTGQSSIKELRGVINQNMPWVFMKTSTKYLDMKIMFRNSKEKFIMTSINDNNFVLLYFIFLFLN